MLVPTTAESLMKYNDKFYDSFSAVTLNKFGNGEVYYIGCGLENSLMELVIDKALENTTITSEITPDGVEVIERGVANNKVKIYINHNDYPVKFNNIELKEFEYKFITK